MMFFNLGFAVTRHVTREQRAVVLQHARIVYEMPDNEDHLGIYAIMDDTTRNAVVQFEEARRAVQLHITVRYLCIVETHPCLAVHARAVWPRLGVIQPPRRGIIQLIAREGPVVTGVYFNADTLVLYIDRAGHVADVLPAIDDFMECFERHEARLTHAIVAAVQ